MCNRNDNPRRKFDLMISAACASSSAIQAADASRLPDAVIFAACRKWCLVPRVRGAAVQQIGIEQATCNLTELDRWADQFPGCDWALRTGPESGVVVLEADAGYGLGQIQALSEFECPETLRAHTGSRLMAFFRYPQGMRAMQTGKITFTPGLAVRADDDQVILPTHLRGAWPNPDAPVLDIPEWPRVCAFEAIEEQSAQLSVSTPPRMEIVGGNQWSGRKS